MRRACIDIGSNTTRLLVADCGDRGLRPVHQERAFTRIGTGVAREGTIAPVKIAEVVEVISAQLARARELGAEEVAGVGTAALRRATNGLALVEAVERSCGLPIEILSGEDEARLAFLGVAGTLGHVPAGVLGVVDVGGGSSELVIGSAPSTVLWWSSFGLGSGELTDACLHSDPPTAGEVAAARAKIALALRGVDAPHPAEAVAVVGSSASLYRLAGPVLDESAFARSLRLLAAEPAAAVAGRLGLDVERVRLLPAGLLILHAAAVVFGAPLQIGRGGLREGVLLRAEAA